MSVPWEMTVEQIEDAARQAERANRADICSRCGVVALESKENEEQARTGVPIFHSSIYFNCYGHSRSTEPRERVH